MNIYPKRPRWQSLQHLRRLLGLFLGHKIRLSAVPHRIYPVQNCLFSPHTSDIPAACVFLSAAKTDEFLLDGHLSQSHME